MSAPEIPHYRILEKLGAGGMGEVFLAEDTRLQRQVALKLLPDDLVDHPDRRRRFLTEARAASSLTHPHVCVIYEVGETDDGRPFLAMEYLEGQSLDQMIDDSPLQNDRVVAIGTQIADALDAAHGKGIIHRDIKPANISINQRGQVKVLDFGLAKLVLLDSDSGEQFTQTQDGQILGTPSYMSPEQALGRTVDHRSDLFSLGVVLYELATSRRPFSGASFGEIVQNIVNVQPPALARFNYGIAPELERIILKCLQKDPQRRFQSARELLVDLNNLASALVNANGTDAVGSHLPSGLSATVDLPLAGAPSEIKQSDIFVSCAQLDDQPLSPGGEGWVSQFQRNLKVRLEQLSGNHVKIAGHPMPPGPARIDPAFFDNLSDVRTLVSIVSPPFAKSEGCQKGVEEFWRGAESTGQLWVEDKPRLFKVVKAPVDNADLPPWLDEMFQQLIPYEFYERDQETGRLREFDEAFGEGARQRYYEKIYDLSYEISQVLKLYGNEHRANQVDGGPTPARIYLAETTSDLQAERDRLKRELLEQGHTVLPDRPLPLIAGRLETAVRAFLDQCDLAIHLVGDRYGLVPEDSELSVVAQQNRLAAEESANRQLERIIWTPRGVQPRDQRQADFLRELLEAPSAHAGAEVIQDTLENLKEYLDEVWQRRTADDDSSGDAAATTNDVPRIYLICDRRDESAVEQIEDFFYAQGIEVSLPEFEQDEATVSQMHWQHLEDCDAALVYYGAGSKSWVDIKLRDLIKATGYRDGRKIEVQGVYVAPPIDRRKERFKTLTTKVYRGSGDAFDPEILNPFVTELQNWKQQQSS